MTPILIQEEQDEQEFQAYNQTEETIKRQTSAENPFDTISSLQSISYHERRSLSPTGEKPKRTHSRSKSADTNKILEKLAEADNCIVQDERPMMRSISLHESLHSNLGAYRRGISSGYESLYPPDFRSQEIHRFGANLVC